MFGKLLKYDFRSMFKQFAFVWAAALALALVNRFTVKSFVASSSEMRHTISGIAMMVYVAILIAMFVIALIFTIQRFYKGLLGDEGYLMFTLPVKPWQLIGSKLLCASVTTFLSVIVAILSILLIVPIELEEWQDLFKAVGDVFSHWSLQATNGIIGLLELCLVMMVSLATGYLQIYLAIAIGHLFSKHRVAMSVLAFIAVNALVSGLGGRIVASAFEPVAKIIDGMNGAAGFHAAMWVVIAGALILCAVFFAGTEFILRNRLNLE